MTAAVPSSAQAGAVPALTPKEKRALREAARRQVLAAERERIERERAAKAGGTPAAAAPPAPGTAQAATPAAPAVPERTDAERARDAGVFLRGVLVPLLAALAAVFGYTLDLDAYTEEQAAEDGRAWVPVLARYAWLDRLVTAVTAPARLVARVRELAKPKPPKERQ